MKILIHCLALLMCVPLIAQAQVNKCKQPDGSLSFQDAPCPLGAASSTITLLPVTSRSNSVPGGVKDDGGVMQSRQRRSPTQEIKSPLDQVRDYQKLRAEQEQQKRLDEAEAFQRNQRCNYARQQLGVVKEERPVYHYNDKGERQYMEDKDRAAAVSAAEQRVARDCS